jgi:AcrR family transcriptional regulator
MDKLLQKEHTVSYEVLCNESRVILCTKQGSLSPKCLIWDKEHKLTRPVNNLRVRRTQKLLREALIDLIGLYGFEALTIGQITERAMVSRAAFYRNYQDKYDLVEQIFIEAMTALQEAISELGTEHPPMIWVNFFEHIASYQRLYQALLGRKGSPWFVQRMHMSLLDLLTERGRLTHREEPVHPAHSDSYITNLISAMVVESITWWLEADNAYSPQEMARRTSLLTAALFREASTWY